MEEFEEKVKELQKVTSELNSLYYTNKLDTRYSLEINFHLWKMIKEAEMLPNRIFELLTAFNK